MTFSDWEWSRIRARLITYYFHQEEDVATRSARRAAIRSKEKIGENSYDDPAIKPKSLFFLNSDLYKKEVRFDAIKAAKPKTNVASNKSDPSSEKTDKNVAQKKSIDRDSHGWIDVAYKILTSEHTSLTPPDNVNSNAALGKRGIDSDWEIKGESLRRYYDGDFKEPTKATGGLETRVIPKPPDTIMKAIYDFLWSIGYISKDDLVEPTRWMLPDDAILAEMGVSQEELGGSKIPHLLSRDYISYSNGNAATSTALMSIYTKFAHTPCKVRYITEERFKLKQSNQETSSSGERWKWHWGWILFETMDSAVTKLIDENPYTTSTQCFWLSDFSQGKEGVIKIGMSEPNCFSLSTDDVRIVELLRLIPDNVRSSFRNFIISKLKFLTFIINSYRFKKSDRDDLTVLGYVESTENGDDNSASNEESKRLVEEFISEIQTQVPKEGEGYVMSDEELYYEGIVFQEEPGQTHVMNMSLNEVVERSLLGERLMATVEFGFPWHISELIELGANPNFKQEHMKATPLHIIAANSANGHLREFTKAIKENGSMLTFNTLADDGRLPSQVAAELCVNQEITEYLFTMERLEREGRKGFIPFEDGVFTKSQSPHFPTDTEENQPYSPKP